MLVASRDDDADIVLGHLSRQSVAAEHERVAAAHVLVREIDLDRRLWAERLENDVAALALRGFFFRELAGLDELLHQRLIFRDLLRRRRRERDSARLSPTCARYSVSPSKPATVAVVPMPRYSGCDAAKALMCSFADFVACLRRATKLSGSAPAHEPVRAQLADDDLDRHRAGDSPAAAPPMPSATMNSVPLAAGGMRERSTSVQRRASVDRSATTNASSLCSRVRPTSVRPNDVDDDLAGPDAAFEVELIEEEEGSETGTI